MFLCGNKFSTQQKRFSYPRHNLLHTHTHECVHACLRADMHACVCLLLFSFSTSMTCFFHSSKVGMSSLLGTEASVSGATPASPTWKQQQAEDDPPEASSSPRGTQQNTALSEGGCSSRPGAGNLFYINFAAWIFVTCFGGRTFFFRPIKITHSPHNLHAQQFHSLN